MTSIYETSKNEYIITVILKLLIFFRKEKRKEKTLKNVGKICLRKEFSTVLLKCASMHLFNYYKTHTQGWFYEILHRLQICAYVYVSVWMQKFASLKILFVHFFPPISPHIGAFWSTVPENVK